MLGKTQPTTSALLQGCGWLGALGKYRQPCALRIVMIRLQSTFSPMDGDSLVYPALYAEALPNKLSLTSFASEGILLLLGLSRTSITCNNVW